MTGALLALPQEDNICRIKIGKNSLIIDAPYGLMTLKYSLFVYVDYLRKSEENKGGLQAPKTAL